MMIVISKLAGLIVVGGAFFYYPLHVALNPPTSSKADKPLDHQSVMRGPFMNSGSKDIGRSDVPTKPPKQ
jgi:hypothetical protein